MSKFLSLLSFQIITGLFFSFLVSPVASAATIDFVYSARSFTLVTPTSNSAPYLSLLQGPNKAPLKPLIVMLHGCKQNARMIIEGTRMDQEAAKNDFYVLAPEQSIYYNMDHCWNWFYPQQQERNLYNEMNQIISAIDLIATQYPINRSKIYLAGMSAGGALGHAMAACYPDYFTGVAIQSGLSFKIAESLNDAQNVLTAQELPSPEYMGKKAFECDRHVPAQKLNKIILIHGASDVRVLPIHSQLISDTNEVWWDYLDNGQRDHSNTFVSTQTNTNAPNHYVIHSTIKKYKYNNMIEQKILIDGMIHAWGGGLPLSINFDPLAPSSTDLILNFFNLKK